MYDTIIKGGTIVTAERSFEGTIGICDGKIVAITNKDLQLTAKEVIDVSGMYVFPGVIDDHAHLNDPGYTLREDFKHGSEAAAVGGVTTIIDMPLQNDPTPIDKKTLHQKIAAISPQAYVDYALWGGMVAQNFNLPEKLTELDDEGCVAFKVFIAPALGYDKLNVGQIRIALKTAVKLDARVGFHCEDASILIANEAELAASKKKATWQDFLDSRPLVGELIAVENVIQLAKETGAKVFICHISHPAVVDLVYQAREEGVDIVGETCTHYLAFSEEDVLKKGGIYKCAPALRAPAAREGLWDCVLDGSLTCVSTDHSPCEESEKSEKIHDVMKVWGGISGIQSILQVMFDEGVNKRQVDPSVLASCLAKGPALTFGIWGKKGDIAPGFDADLVILDPNKEWTITPDSLFYKNKLSAFCGMKGKGLPVMTILRGKVIVKDGQLCGVNGQGERVKKIK